MATMKNLTITVEDDVLDWARIEAARRGTSVSRMVGDFMAEMRQRGLVFGRCALIVDDRLQHPLAGDQPGNVLHGMRPWRSEVQQ